MNVWIVNPFDNLPLEGNRPQRYWLMARAFAAAGHRVTLWTSDFSHATKRRRTVRDAGGERDGARAAAASRRLRAEGLDVVLLPTRPYPANVCWQRILSHRRLARTFAEAARRAARPDLVVASTPPVGLCAAARRVAKACGATFVCDIQDAWPETFARLFPRGLKRLGMLALAPMRRAIRAVYREADVVTGVCRRYARLSGRPDFLLAYHGIAAEADGRHRPAAAPPPAPRLVYVGNLGAGYDLATAIRALAARPAWTLDVAGLGPRLAALKAEAAARGVADRVRFHGYLGAADLEALLASCSVGLVPMRDDSWVGLPYKLGDYLKAGLPVVSSLHGECGELLARTGTGRTYDWGDGASFIRAVEGVPAGRVALPEELRAETIYAQYVRHLCERAARPRGHDALS
ncbi:MAG: glycosyltransferase [Kiritimatiellia bacterium]